MFLTAAETAGATQALSDVLSGLNLPKIVSAVVLLIVCLIAVKVLMKLTEKLLSRSKVEISLHSIIRSFVKILLLFVTLMLVAGSLGIDTSSLLAILSVAGLAASLALQDTLSNFASGVQILMTKPFKVGDFVTVAGHTGTVQNIGISYTKLATVDNQDILIPNKSITSSSIVNFSSEEKRRLDLVFTASYDSPTEAVIEALQEAAAIDLVCREDPVFVRLSGYGDYAVEYTLRVWVKNADYWDAHFAILERVRSSYADHGVQMTYPHIRVHPEKS